MKNRVLSGWNGSRLIRVVVGLAIMLAGFFDQNGVQWILLLAGLLFVAQGVLNLGCNTCFSGSCEYTATKMSKSKSDEN